MLVYTAGVFYHCGNIIKGMKFVPEFDKNKFITIVKSSENYERFLPIIDYILEKISDEIYSDGMKSMKNK